MSEVKNVLATADELGAVHISEDVIGSITALAACEVEGVAGLSSVNAIELPGLLGKKKAMRGINISVNSNQVTCDVFILIKRTFAILKVSQAVQEKVKAHIESMTGFVVAAVHVHVVGIAFEKPSKKQKS